MRRRFYPTDFIFLLPIRAEPNTLKIDTERMNAIVKRLGGRRRDSLRLDDIRA